MWCEVWESERVKESANFIYLDEREFFVTCKTEAWGSGLNILFILREIRSNDVVWESYRWKKMKSDSINLDRWKKDQHRIMLKKEAVVTNYSLRKIRSKNDVVWESYRWKKVQISLI